MRRQTHTCMTGTTNLEFASQKYYYQPVSQRKHTTMASLKQLKATTNTYRSEISLLGENEPFMDKKQIKNCGEFLYTSQPQIANVHTTTPQATPTITDFRHTPAVRRHPVTVRTPRYYKRSSACGIYKGPSFLCLPVTYQPDPALTRTVKRSHQQQRSSHRYSNNLCHPYITVDKAKKIGDSPSETLIEMSKCDNQPAEGKTINAKLNLVQSRYKNALEKGSCKRELRKLTNIATNTEQKNYLSIKDNQIKLLNLRPEGTKENPKIKKRCFVSNNTNTLEVEEVTVDVLDKILLQLKTSTTQSKREKKSGKHNCESNNNIGDEEKTDNTMKVDKNELDDKSVQCETKSENLVGEAKEAILTNKIYPNSFNYNEISQKMSKCKSQYHNKSELVSQLNKSPKRSTNMYTTQVESLSKPSVNLKTQLKSNIVPRILVDDALELHKTKSYVVNLIDQALSNHFNTTLMHKCEKEESNLQPNSQMEMLKNISTKQIDKDLCAEITHALAESYVYDKEPLQFNSIKLKSKQNLICSCNKEETLYIKLLKQLRWGHLKHIQREIGKLEDLERILESCSNTLF